MEAMNHYYKCAGYNDAGDYHYLSKAGNVEEFNYFEWRSRALKLVNIDFHEATFSNTLGNHDDIKGHFYFRSAYRNEPDFQIESMQKQQDPTKSIRLSSLIQNDQTVSANYQRLIANAIVGVFDNANDTKVVATLRDELIGKFNQHLNVYSKIWNSHRLVIRCKMVTSILLKEPLKISVIAISRQEKNLPLI